jgi:hypothetical protein
MDNFERAVAESLNRLWGYIGDSINESTQALAGRSGSSIAEDIILDVMEELPVESLTSLKEEIDSVLIADENPYRFFGFRFRPKDGNKEAHSRSIEDVIVLLELDGEVIDAFVNIKVSNGKNGQADNSCSWKAAAYALYGRLDVTRRDGFLKITGNFTDKEHHNYFFWVLFKNEDATVLRNGHVNSLLSIDPDTGLRFNINQPFPVQVVHSVDIGHTASDHGSLSMAQRRSIFHSWLTIRMGDKYSDLSSNVIDSLVSHPSTDNLSSYLALLEAQKDQMKKLNDLINETKRLKVQEELAADGIDVVSVVLEAGEIRAYMDDTRYSVHALAEV